MQLPPKLQAFVDAVLGGPGESDPQLRRAALRRAGLGARHELDPEGDEPPAELVPYLDKVARHAYRVTDEDLEALKSAGYSEDQILELTVSVAVGAALARYRMGLAALAELESTEKEK